MLWGSCSSLAGRGLRRAFNSTVFVLAVLAGAAQSHAVLPEEQLTYQTDARFGRVLSIRNEAAQVTAADVARRVPQTPSPSGPLLNSADLDKPEWSNAVATARAFLRRHGSDFLGVAASRQSAANLATNDQRRSPDTSTGGASVPASQGMASGRLASTLAPPTASASDPDADLALLRAERDALGMTHVRFTQTYRGLPVFGADAAVHLAADGRVSSANARLAPDIQVDVQPTLTREQAVLVAVALWQAQFHRTETPEATSTNLCILAPDLLKNDGNPATYLVWEVKLRLGCMDCPVAQSREYYYVDAHTGELREQISGMQYLYRKVYDCTANPSSGLCWSHLVDTNGYHHGRWEGESSWGPNPTYGTYDVDLLYDHFGNLHNYLAVKFGRNGVNGQGGLGDGGKLPLTTTAGNTYENVFWGSSCPNAVFDHGGVAFCNNGVQADVVAHEYMHGLPYFSIPGGLGNYGTSGTLNESQSDLWGELYQLYLTATADWINWPEGASGGSGRNLADPNFSTYAISGQNFSYPDRLHSINEFCGSWDNNGAHVNSTLVSKGAYLLAEGGLFNGCTIIGIGADKLEQILYRVVTQYYSSSASFNSAYYNWIQAATDLYGAGSDEVRQVTRAIQSVELDQPGYCSGLPARLPAAVDPVGW